MLDINYTRVTGDDTQLALGVIRALADSLGNAESRDVSAAAIHRVLSLASGMIVEADLTVGMATGFTSAGAYLGKIIAHHAQSSRQEREMTGIGLVERALSAEPALRIAI